jgi:orotidine-5'-phosphate decarboxylase
MPHAILLLPGYGAQGGSARDLADAFDDRGLGGVVNNSRGLIFAHQSEKYRSRNWRDAVRAATEAMIDELAQHTPAGNLR